MALSAADVGTRPWQLCDALLLTSPLQEAQQRVLSMNLLRQSNEQQMTCCRSVGRQRSCDSAADAALA